MEINKGKRGLVPHRILVFLHRLSISNGNAHIHVRVRDHYVNYDYCRKELVFLHLYKTAVPLNKIQLFRISNVCFTHPCTRSDI